MRWSIAFLPLIGMIIGSAALLWNVISVHLQIGGFLRGTVFMILPVLITGGIHLDGFCDTVDALASHADIDKKQKILKDPHAGAFAIIAVACYLLLYTALGSELTGDWNTVGVFACIPVISRCLAGWSVVSFPCSDDSGLVRTFSAAAPKRILGVLLAVTTAVIIVVMILMGGLTGAVTVFSVLLVFIIYRFWLIHQFGGLSGDLAGWFIQMCEICAFTTLTFTQLICKEI
jgi:adenosylcobinamide-GDP ribazoletransferase